MFTIKAFLILSFLILQLTCLEESEISFNVSSIEKSQLGCISNIGTYIFYLIGEFSSTPSILNPITLNLTIPKNATALCYPFFKTSVSADLLQCEINICDYLIEDEVILSVEKPVVEGYSFPNWKETIGASPGESNRVDDNVVCTLEAKAAFTTDSIESSGCKGKTNIFKINGKWSNETEDLGFVLDVEGSEEKAICEYKNQKKDYIQCEFGGEGDIKIYDKYFKTNINVYFLLESNSTIHLNKCNNPEKFLAILTLALIPSDIFSSKEDNNFLFSS